MHHHLGCVVVVVIGCWFAVCLVCGLHSVVMAVFLHLLIVPKQPFSLLSLLHVGDAWWAHRLLLWAAAPFRAPLPLSCCLAFVTLPPFGPGITLISLAISLLWAFSIGSALPELNMYMYMYMYVVLGVLWVLSLQGVLL